MSHDNHMRDRDLLPGEKTLTEQMLYTYQPKHLKQFDDSWDHCCFSGCTPMGCPGGCCLNMGWHRASCPSNPWREFDEAEHDIYVNNGMRQHLRQPEMCNGEYRCKATVHVHGCYADQPQWVDS